MLFEWIESTPTRISHILTPMSGFFTDQVYFHTREGDTGPEYQVVCADPDDVLRADGRVDRASELDSISTLVS